MVEFERFFESGKGRELYKTFLKTVEKDGMSSMIEDGVLVGFSGGADSVMLLLCLLEYSRAKNFKILLCHVNHNIRGQEAERDEAFCRKVAERFNLEITVASPDVPALAAASGKGLEETARNARYSEFNRILQSRNDIKTISLAHNSTDNLETVIFNMARGTGLRGLCGILPVRDRIVRPLINITSADIRDALDSVGARYVYDSTNSSLEYTRNFIRHRIIPSLRELNGSVEKNVSNMCSSLVYDRNFIEKCAMAVIDKGAEGVFAFSDLLSLERSVFSSFFSIFAKKHLGVSVSSEHINSAYFLLHSDNNSFRLSLPDGSLFISEQGKCLFTNKEKMQKRDFLKIPLNMGENIIDGYNAVIILKNSEEEYKTSSNVYKITTEVKFPSDIIKEGLYVRFRENGDSYRYDGMSHKLKKVFNDRNIPPYERDNIPIICDGDGILWVPGLPVRDYPEKQRLGEYITLCLAEKEASCGEITIRTAKNK